MNIRFLELICVPVGLWIVSEIPVSKMFRIGLVRPGRTWTGDLVPIVPKEPQLS